MATLLSTDVDKDEVLAALAKEGSLFDGRAGRSEAMGRRDLCAVVVPGRVVQRSSRVFQSFWFVLPAAFCYGPEGKAGISMVRIELHRLEHRQDEASHKMPNTGRGKNQPGQRYRAPTRAIKPNAS